MAVVIPYTKQTWTDGVSSCSAARNNVHEDGINDAHYQPSVRVFHNANQAITTATITALAFNSERFDTAGNVASTMHDTATNNSRLTCRHAGKYLIVGSVQWEAVAAGTYRQIAIRISVGPTVIARQLDPQTSGGLARQTVTTIYDMAVNDYVELIVDHDRGSNLNVVASGNDSPEFMMVRLG